MFFSGVRSCIERTELTDRYGEISEGIRKQEGQKSLARHRSYNQNDIYNSSRLTLIMLIESQHAISVAIVIFALPVAVYDITKFNLSKCSVFESMTFNK